MTEFYASCNEFPSIRHKISTSVTSTIPIKPVKRVIQTGVSVDSRYPSTDYDECDEMDHEMDQPTELMHIQLPAPAAVVSNDNLPPEVATLNARWRTYAATKCPINKNFAQYYSRHSADDEDGADEGFRGRRRTITSKFPVSNSATSNGGSNNNNTPRRFLPRLRKFSHGDVMANVSIDASKIYDLAENTNDEDRSLFGSSYKISSPDRSLLSANYAFFRRSIDLNFEIVAAFDKNHSDVYRHFLQSLSCYDLAPPHGMVIMLDANLLIRKAVSILCTNPPPRVAMICNVDNAQREGSDLALFSLTDCLHILKAAVERNSKIGNETLSYFLELNQKRKGLISVNSVTTVWDLARMFLLNKVHRIPVFEAETSEVLSITCPRLISVELLRLINSKYIPSPNLQTIEIGSKLIGTWSDISTITTNDQCSKAIDLLLSRRISALPVLDPDSKKVLGILDKGSLIESVAKYTSDNYQHLFELPIKDAVQLEKVVTIPPDTTIADGIRYLVEDGFCESIFITTEEQKLLGVVSHMDIIAYLINGTSEDDGVSPEIVFSS